MIIDYNKEYLELIRAFIPNAKDEGYFISIEDEEFILKLDNEIYKIPRNIEVFNSDLKNHVKYHIYKVLSGVINKYPQWGILVGIRPLKLIRNFIDNYGFEIAKDKLMKNYFVSEKKIDLAIEIINVQKDALKFMGSGYSIYVDIPFCPSKCNYCSFTTFKPTDEKIENYLKALFNEVSTTANYFKNVQPTCVYIGGGTPSAIGEKHLKSVIEKIMNTFGKPKEFTVEIGRPDTIDESLLKTLKGLGVERISINPQSMNDSTLKSIGRNHSCSDVVYSYNLAKEIGFKDINMDLILGLPGENLENIKKTLDEIEKLNPTSLSIHSLALKKGSKLKDENFTAIEDQNIEELRDSFIKRNSYLPYYLYRQKNITLNIENIGYSKKGYESLYNILMMEDAQSVLGLGLGATTKIIGKNRFKTHINTKDLNQYLEYDKEIPKDKLDYLKEQINEAK